jgi:hypothetical protein
MNITCSDLAEFGLPLVTPEDADFTRLADEIRNRLSPAQRFMEGDRTGVAVVVNQSGKTVLSLAVVFAFQDAEGRRSTNHFSGPFSAGGLGDVLTGAVPVDPRTPGHIFPGSKRLLTARGVWGDNTDVLPPDANDPRRGLAGGGFGWTGTVPRAAEPVSGDLLLDLAIFEDGLCVGPDRYGGFDALMTELSERRTVATEILQALEKGASRGDIFEMVRLLAKGPPPPPPPARTGPQMHPPHLHTRHQFAQTVIHQLVQLDDVALRSVFENAARSLAIQLRRPSIQLRRP